MTRVFYASTLFGAMSLAAAIDSGMFGGHDERRLLIVSNNVAVPEITDPFDRTAGFAPLRGRFDDIVHWNELIAPMHPSHWQPSPAELPMLSRLVTERLGLRDGVAELVLESVAVAPARTIGSLLRECPITVYSDGLMSYGPTRDHLPLEVGQRVSRLVYLDLVPSVTPLLLHEYEVLPVALDPAAFTGVADELPSADVGDAAGRPVILGQYLAQLGLIEDREELRLLVDMLSALAARGERHIVFRPHPAARRAQVAHLRERADALGVRLDVPDDGLPAEAWFAAARPSLVVSCFSTALFTASRLYGLRVATMGTEQALQRIAPYENSNRIPLTIADAALDRLNHDGTIVPPRRQEVGELVRAVGYCMQATRMVDLRDSAAAFVATADADDRVRYFKRKRLEGVGLVRPAKTDARRRVARAAGRRLNAATAVARSRTGTAR